MFGNSELKQTINNLDRDVGVLEDRANYQQERISNLRNNLEDRVEVATSRIDRIGYVKSKLNLGEEETGIELAGRSIPINEALELVLKHLGLELVHTAELTIPDKVTLKLAPTVWIKTPAKRKYTRRK